MSCNFSDDEIYEVIREIKEKSNDSEDGLTRLESAAIMILEERELVEEMLLEKVENILNTCKSICSEEDCEEDCEENCCESNSVCEKTLNVVSEEDAVNKVSDVEIFGNGDLFKLISKASSKSQGWMESTKVCNLDNGVLIQVTTQNKENVAEALQFVPNVNWNFEFNDFEYFDETYEMYLTLPE